MMNIIERIFGWFVVNSKEYKARFPTEGIIVEGNNPPITIDLNGNVSPPGTVCPSTKLHIEKNYEMDGDTIDAHLHFGKVKDKHHE